MKVICNAGCMMLFLYSTHSWAFSNCKANSSGITINTSPLIINRDAVNGTRIEPSNVTSPVTLLYTCPEGLYYPSGTQYLGVKAITVASGMSIGGSPIFNTNIPGLGVQLAGVTSVGHIAGWIGTGNNIDGNINQNAIYSSEYALPSVYGGAAVSFYKTGPMTSGVLTQRVGSMILGTAGNWAPEIPINISGMTVTVLSCSLTTPTVTVPLGNIYATSFTGVGSFTGAQSFNLGLNCASGSKINVSMTGTQDTNTVNTSVLALTGAGTAGVAKGVGAQILYNNSPLTIGSQLLLKTSEGGVETFPFTARYYQTLSNILPGTANATATLNITYQ